MDYLVGLSAGVEGVDIQAPADLRFNTLRTWLENNTDNIGAVLQNLYPKEPQKIIEVYEQIADIFFFHVDQGDVTPDLEGHINRLPSDDPNNMRLRADCDVLATYAMRLLRSSGFTPVGYLLVIPEGNDNHAVGLVIKDGQYYVINNKQVTAVAAADKDDALKATRDDAMGVYDPAPAQYKIYYSDATIPNGGMEATLPTLREADRKNNLEPPSPAAEEGP